MLAALAAVIPAGSRVKRNEMAMRTKAITAAVALAVAGVALGARGAHADPTIDMPSWMGGDHDPYPLIAALVKWDPTALGMTTTQAENNAVIFCAMRHDGASEASIVKQMSDGDEATFTPVLRAAEEHFCPQYS